MTISFRNLDETQNFIRMVRKQIAEKAEAGNYSELNDAVNALAEAQGAEYVFRVSDDLVAKGSSVLDLIEEFTRILSQPPADTVSGRSNDARRCYVDGVRSVASLLSNRLFARLSTATI